MTPFEAFIKRHAVPVVTLLVVSNVVSCWYFLEHGHSLDPSQSPYPLIDPARNFIPQEHFLTNIQPLRERVHELAAEYGEDSVSLYIEYLNTGANISINQDRYLWPASLAKVPVALAVVKKVQDGVWDLDSKLVLLEGDADFASGAPEHFLASDPIGTTYTIEELLKSLLTDSDNTAYFILLRNLSESELRAVIDALGLEALFAEDGRVSAKEYSRILRSLYTASFLNRAHSELLLKFLDESPFDQFLADVVPQDVPFPHKYGLHKETRIYADSGIVYIPNRPYIISVMAQGDKSISEEESERRVEEFMRAVSKEAYEFFSTNTSS